MSFTRFPSPRTLILKESISMTIYTSDKAVPYVYICVHKETDQFYIGYREKNVRLNRPSHLDLPKYKTSSTTVRPDWENYNWTIVAEFFDPSDAYTFEQQLIYDNWKNPLLLNGHYNLGERKFRPIGPSPLKGKPSPLKGIPNGRKGVPNGRKGIPSPIKGKPGKPHSTEANQKKSERMTGKPSGRKGIPNGKQKIPQINLPCCIQGFHIFLGNLLNDTLRDNLDGTFTFVQSVFVCIVRYFKSTHPI
jgi:hypothetical protein